MMRFYVAPRHRARWANRMHDTSRAEIHVPVDVIADGEGYTITAYVPGVKAEDVEIEILENVVSIRGEFEGMEDENGETRYLLRERPTGRFGRTLRLPAAVDADSAEAKVSDGVLTLSVAKAEHEKAKKIAVKMS